MVKGQSREGGKGENKKTPEVTGKGCQQLVAQKKVKKAYRERTLPGEPKNRTKSSL